MRAGHKQTEVGVVPGDWRVVAVKEHASIRTGERNTQDRIDDGAYPFFVRSQVVERINSYSYDGEAVVTAGDGVGTGKVFHYVNGKFDLHQRAYRISDFSPELHGLFFYYYFSSHFYDRIMSMTAKSSVDSVRMEMIADMPIPLPPVPEQRAIAQALGDVDAQIATQEKLIAKKRDLKQAAMQELLTGRTRLPGFVAPWASASFDDVLVRLNAKAHQIPASEYQSGGTIPVVDQGQDLVVGFTDDEGKRFKCPDGGVIVFGDHTCIVKFIDFDFAVGADGTQILAARAEHSTRFLSYQLQHHGVTGTGYNRHFRFLAERSFVVPREPEQTAIGSVLSDMDMEIAALEARLTKTWDLKQGMMQELLTGRTRLV